MLARLWRVLLAACLVAHALQARPAAVLLDGDGPWANTEWRESAAVFRSLLTDAGFEVRAVSPPSLAEALAGPGITLVAAPSLETLPVSAIRSLVGFHEKGGSLLASGSGEPFRAPLFRDERGRWVPERAVLTAGKPGRVIFEPALLKSLERSSDNFTSEPAFDLGQPGPDGSFNCLTIRIPKLTGFDLLQAMPFPSSPFQKGESLTLVTVRGAPSQTLVVHWRDTAGWEYSATVPLESSWKTHALRPSDFGPDELLLKTHERFEILNRPPRPPRTRKFDVAEARVLRFGASVKFGARPGELWYSIGPVAVAAPLPGLEEPFATPAIETVSPWYKQYVTTRGGRQVRIPVPRARGLSAAPEPEGRYRVAGGLESPSATRYFAANGAAVIWVPSLALSAEARAGVADLLRGVARRVAFLNSGPTDFVFLPGERVGFGARVINVSSAAVEGTVVWSIRQGGKPLRERAVPITVRPGEVSQVSGEIPEPLPAGNYEAISILRVGGLECDFGDTPFRVLDPDAPRAPRRIRSESGHFTLDGKRIYLNGVNYRPRATGGLEIKRYGESWLRQRNYDADVVEADLDLMEKLGINLICINYTNPEEARTLPDVLERCRKHGIWANLYTGSASGLRYEPEREKKLLAAARLGNNDTVFGYDLAWEPRFGDSKERRRFDPQWREWIAEQYGSIAAAERAWSMSPPRDEKGEVTNPADRLLRVDGPYRVLVAAYRRFMDDLVSRRYGRVVRAMRTVDPHGLMGVRTGYGGTGTQMNNDVAGYDLAAGAVHLDFVSPEGWGTPVKFEQARSTGFITAYGRYAGNGKPVLWCEFGARVGPRYGVPYSHMMQGSMYDTMFRVIQDSGADGSSSWWWPGGWRLNEVSDSGLIEPDGRLRESAKVLSRWGRLLAGPSPAVSKPVELAVDRDADSRGIYGLFQRSADAYLEARAKGRSVRLVNAGSGSDTATMPMVQVGNVPYGGTGPLKYANAEIAGIRVSWPSGNEFVENGAEVPVPAGGCCTLTVVLLNTGDAKWLGARQPLQPGGCVFRVRGEDVPVRAEVPRFGRAEVGPFKVQLANGATTHVRGRVRSHERGEFGEVLHLQLVSKER